MSSKQYEENGYNLDVDLLYSCSNNHIINIIGEVDIGFNMFPLSKPILG